MSSERDRVKEFCEEVNKSSSILKIYYTSFDGMAIGYRDLKAQIGEGTVVANRIKDFMNNHVFCARCGESIKKLKEEKTNGNTE